MVLDDLADDIPDESSFAAGNMISEFVHQAFAEVVLDDVAQEVKRAVSSCRVGRVGEDESQPGLSLTGIFVDFSVVVS